MKEYKFFEAITPQLLVEGINAIIKEKPHDWKLLPETFIRYGDNFIVLFERKLP